LYYGDGGARAGDRDPAGRIHTRRHGPTLPAGWTRVRLTPKRRYLFVLGHPAQQRARRRHLQIQAVAFQPVLPFVWTLLTALRHYGAGDRRFADLKIMSSHVFGRAQSGAFAGYAAPPL